MTATPVRAPVPLVAPPERGPVPRLDNMRAGPTTAVVHPWDPARLLVPALRLVLGPDLTALARSPALARSLALARRLAKPSPETAPPDRLLRAVDPAADPRPPDACTGRLEAICDAVVELLRLPPVIVVDAAARVGAAVVHEPLLALTLLARCGGRLWLARRPASFEGIRRDDEVTILLPEHHLRRIDAAIRAPGWREQVLARATDLEASR